MVVEFFEKCDMVGLTVFREFVWVERHWQPKICKFESKFRFVKEVENMKTRSFSRYVFLKRYEKFFKGNLVKETSYVLY